MLITLRSAGEGLLNSHGPGSIPSEGCITFRCCLHWSKAADLCIDHSEQWGSVGAGLKGRDLEEGGLMFQQLCVQLLVNEASKIPCEAWFRHMGGVNEVEACSSGRMDCASVNCW